MHELTQGLENPVVSVGNPSPLDCSASEVAIHMGNPSIGRLISTAAEGLVRMFDVQRQLFCFRRRQTADRELISESHSHRYTIMSLLGLHELEKASGHSPISSVGIASNLLRDRSYIRTGADVGLTLWFVARVTPSELGAICSTLDLDNAINRYSDVRLGKTMEIAWLLAGLSHLAIADPAQGRKYAKTAKEIYKLLVENQGAHGIFGHQTTRSSLRGLIRGRIGSFADQIYPIYALSQYAKAYGEEEPVQCAIRCADAICEAQGPLGQWWWHYDAGAGKVFRRYPVYSVHQDGMAPMGLFALGEVSNKSYETNILNGLKWIFGVNELRHNMVDRSNLIIWRAIAQHGRETAGVTEALSWLIHGDTTKPKNLAVLHECRPYHFGWLLYAFASRRSR